MEVKVKNKTLVFGLCALTVAAMLLASCNNTATTTSTTTPTQATTTQPTTTTTTSNPVTTGVTTTSSTATTGKWWDKLGVPQYGGEIVTRSNKDIVGFDPGVGSAGSGGVSYLQAWMEPLHCDDWTVDPNTFSYQLQFRPNEWVKGELAASWEMTDSSTYVVHLRQGVHWQNIAPMNGREFVADDVLYHYDRMLGTGHGFTTKSTANPSDVSAYALLISVTSPDKYTVIFKWNSFNPENIMETMQGISTNGQIMEAREAVTQWGDLSDWHHAVGTGPWMIKDFVTGASLSLIRNPDYWAYDERYPQNRLPYADSYKILVIPNDATALAAMRTGKIDCMEAISISSAGSMAKTNPEILKVAVPQLSAQGLIPRVDTAPYKDVRVRQALQMAIDLPAINSALYANTADPYPSTLTSFYMTGWGFPYQVWPQDLKDQYAYNVDGAKKLLADAGYPNGFTTNVVADNSGDMDLMQIVQSYYAKIGVTMEIRPMDNVAWSAFVITNHKQDALGYRSTGALGQTYSPIRALRLFQSGYAADWGMVSDPTFDAFYPAAMAATNLADIKKIVSNANEYVARQHFAISFLAPKLYNLYQPWFKGYSGQNGAVGTGSSFYTSRFWVDSKMKKSLGH
jgi:peptide/nickel transport system substrate-binding protein